MAKVTPAEPQSATGYDDRTTAAVKSVLVEIGQILGSFKGKFAVIGGAVPWLLLGNEDMPHVGTLDVDLGLDAEALPREPQGGSDCRGVRQELVGLQREPEAGGPVANCLGRTLSRARIFGGNAADDDDDDDDDDDNRRKTDRSRDNDFGL
jgi:hypothetical protein